MTGRVVVLPGADIDTDRIMPARFLKAISFGGLEAHLCADDRAEARARGAVHPLDAPGAAGARVLIAGPNFGCGSSREHAPQALQRWGFQVIVAESFAEIFLGNATAIGLACATASGADLAEIMRVAEADPQAEWRFDLQDLRLAGPRGQWRTQMTPAVHHALVTGEWDTTGLLLAGYDEVERVEARLPYLRTTSRNA